MTKDDLKPDAGEQRNPLQAAALARDQGLSQNEIQELQHQALWYVAAVNRNAVATKILANQYGISKEQLREFLKKHAECNKDTGQDKALKPRYDYALDKHLDFLEWMEQFFRKWNKMPDK